ncbi:MAG: phytanoyl-CoA dioxygenase family protein [Myxococcota bacterium]
MLEEPVPTDLDAVLRSFRTAGYARLGRVLRDDAARSLGARAEALMLADAPLPGLFFQPEPASRDYADVEFGRGWIGPTLAYRKLERLELDPLFAAWIENPLFAELARRALGDAVSLYRSVLWNKGPDGGMAVPWHQDDGRFWGLDRPPSLQVWTALDDAPAEAGCLEVVPGSHLGGLATPEGGTLTGALVDEADARALALPAVRGECILVHNHLWHRTGVNRTGAPRKALSVSFLDASTRCTRRKRAARSFRPVFRGEPTG